MKVLVWRKSVYDNGFKCNKCKTVLANEKGEANEILIIQNKEKDALCYCGKCHNKVAVVREYDGDLEPGMHGEWKEEVKCYAFGIGNFKPFAIGRQRRAQKEILELIKGLDGLIGVHPNNPYGTLVVFDTLNNAKGGRNILRSKGIECGKEIGEVFVDKRFV